MGYLAADAGLNPLGIDHVMIHRGAPFYATQVEEVFVVPLVVAPLLLPVLNVTVPASPVPDRGRALLTILRLPVDGESAAAGESDSIHE